MDANATSTWAASARLHLEILSQYESQHSEGASPAMSTRHNDDDLRRVTRYKTPAN